MNPRDIEYKEICLSGYATRILLNENKNKWIFHEVLNPTTYMREDCENEIERTELKIPTSVYAALLLEDFVQFANIEDKVWIVVDDIFEATEKFHIYVEHILLMTTHYLNSFDSRNKKVEK